MEFWKLGQMREGLLLSLASKTPEAKKYLDLRIFLTKESGNTMSLQICLAKRALLKALNL